MSRIFSVVVLCPNGRRETVKVSPNNSILQVLEEACKKQNLNAEEYDIRHYNKTLDLSLPIRFSNLPNNAQLELRPAEKSRKDSIVTIGLQLESGERVMGDYPPSVTLFSILEKSLNSEPTTLKEDGEPVCIYMRQTISGDGLKSTTLRSLGLTKGTAMIRLLHRKPEALEQQAHVSSPLIAPVSKEVTDPQPMKYQAPASPVPEQIKKHPRLDISTEEQDHFPKANVLRVEKGEISPMEVDNCDTNELPQQNVVVRNEKELESKGCHDIESNKLVSFEQEMEFQSEDTFEGIKDIKYIGERHAVIYSLDDITDIKKADLPDDFFDLTINDAKYLMTDYRKQRDQFENQPLLTKEQRQTQILQKFSSYKHTVVRVYFPERLVLQAVFAVGETVQNISDFLRSFLENERLSFYLYITPPKEKLNPNKTLLEAMLVPAAVIYFGCDFSHQRYLAENLKSKLCDPRAAALAAFESRKADRLTEFSSNNLPPVNLSIVPEENQTSKNAMDHSSNETREKLPKWLKLSKK